MHITDIIAKTIRMQPPINEADINRIRKDKISDEDKKVIADAVEEAKKHKDSTDKDELEAAVKALNDAIMPIGAKMYEQAAAEESKEGEAAAEGDDKKSDEPVEGEVVDDAKDSKK